MPRTVLDIEGMMTDKTNLVLVSLELVNVGETDTNLANIYNNESVVC